jgi:arsenate reductase-like glutaredoxin family protein
MKIYGLKNCNKCRDARVELIKNGFSVDFVDVRETPFDVVDLDRLISNFGDDLINKRSTTWRGAKLSDRNLSVIELLQLLPAVMKRPVIDNGALYLGWSEEIMIKILNTR